MLFFCIYVKTERRDVNRSNCQLPMFYNQVFLPKWMCVDEQVIKSGVALSMYKWESLLWVKHTS